MISKHHISFYLICGCVLHCISTSLGSDLCLNSAQPPIKRTRSLGPCSKFDHNTCCNSTKLLRSIAPVIRASNILSSQCFDYTLDAVCAPCDPGIGTGQTVGFCSYFCDAWYNACLSDFFVVKTGNRLFPCTENDPVCGRLDQIVQNSTEFCQFYMDTVVIIDAKNTTDESNIISIDVDGNTASLTGLKYKTKTCYDGTKPMGEGIPESSNAIATSTIQSILFYAFLVGLVTVRWNPSI